MMPGPRDAVRRPRRKTTARSYSRITLRPLASSSKRITKTVAGASNMYGRYHKPAGAKTCAPITCRLHNSALRLNLAAMFRALPPGWRRLVGSLTYAGLVVLVVGLGYLTLHAVSARRHGGGQAAVASADQGAIPLIDVSAFSSRREKSSDAERVSVSVRLRLTTSGAVD